MKILEQRINKTINQLSPIQKGGVGLICALALIAGLACVFAGLNSNDITILDHITHLSTLSLIGVSSSVALVAGIGLYILSSTPKTRLALEGSTDDAGTVQNSQPPVNDSGLQYTTAASLQRMSLEPHKVPIFELLGGRLPSIEVDFDRHPIFFEDERAPTFDPSDTKFADRDAAFQAFCDFFKTKRPSLTDEEMKTAMLYSSQALLNPLLGYFMELDPELLSYSSLEVSEKKITWSRSTDETTTEIHCRVTCEEYALLPGGTPDKTKLKKIHTLTLVVPRLSSTHANIRIDSRTPSEQERCAALEAATTDAERTKAVQDASPLTITTSPHLAAAAAP